MFLRTWWRTFRCSVLEWHSPDKQRLFLRGTWRSTCRHCGAEIYWFTLKGW
jgi:hypothetical protein